jgi:hypothetical protein
MNNEWERIWKETAWHSLLYYDHKNLRYRKRESLEHKSDPWLLEPILSIFFGSLMTLFKPQKLYDTKPHVKLNMNHTLLSRYGYGMSKLWPS